MCLINFKNYQIYLGKNILSIDYGTKVTGLATFCPGTTPFPIPFGKIIYKDDEKLCDSIIDIVDDEAINVIVLGLPLFTDGKESKMSNRVKNFHQLLQKKIPGMEINLHDETLTSYEAETRMKNSPRYNFKVNKKEIDALAASIILEDFIKSE